MNWPSFIADLQRAGMSQASIGHALHKSQAWVAAIAGRQIKDLKWSDGEALIALHGRVCEDTSTCSAKRKNAAEV